MFWQAVQIIRYYRNNIKRKPLWGTRYKVKFPRSHFLKIVAEKLTCLQKK
jgi:hypothetical protein